MLISLFISLFFYFMHLLVTNFSANFLNPFHLQTYFAFECLSKSYLKYDSEFERNKDKCSEVKVCVDANVYIISDHASKTYLSDSSNSFYLLDSIINDDALNIYRFCRYYIWPFRVVNLPISITHKYLFYNQYKWTSFLFWFFGFLDAFYYWFLFLPYLRFT